MCVLDNGGEHIMDPAMARSRRNTRVRGSDQSPRFFKVFFPHLSSDHLKVPPKFLKHIKNQKSPDTVSLKGPSGSIWYMDLVKNSDSFFFEKGWKEFVVDHTLSLGDFLVFQYDGELRFTVFLFDDTACEKEAALSATPCQDDTTFLDMRARGENIGEEDSKPSVVQRNGRFRVTLKRTRRCDDRVVLEEPLQKKISKVSMKNSLDRSGHATVRKSKSNPQSRMAENSLNSRSLATHSPSRSSKVTRGPPSKESQTEMRGRPRVQVVREKRHGGVISQRRPVTKKELDRAHKMAALFKSTNPFCKVKMPATHVYYGFLMDFPRSFVREHLPLENMMMTLWDPDGKSWEVRYISYGLRGALSGGWRKFAISNNLELGDVCIFELIERYQLKVHFFRLVKKIVPLLR